MVLTESVLTGANSIGTGTFFCVHGPKISTSWKKNSTDISAGSAAFCISVVMVMGMWMCMGAVMVMVMVVVMLMVMVVVTMMKNNCPGNAVWT